MILITGAAGKTGKAVVRKVAEKGGIVRAWVFRAEQVQAVAALGANDIVIGDMRDSKVLRQAMQGIDSVYHICPNVHPDEISIAQRIIDLAAASEIDHFVYHSVLHPQVEAMPHHWKKMRVEEYLFTSRLPFTILQPAVYIQNILVNWDRIIETGIYSVPYSITSRISMVDLDDVAGAASKVLLEVSSDEKQPLHIGAIYELVGTPAMTPSEIATVLALQLDCPVVAEKISMATWKKGVQESGMLDYQVNALVKMFKYYEQYGLWGNTQALSWLLKRPPTSFETFVKNVIQERLKDAP